MNLIAYFSASGVTKQAAQKLAQEVNGTLYEIVPKQKYTDADLNWHDDNSRSSVEIKDLNLRPEIEDVNINLDQFDTIYIGFPIWWGIAPNVVKTFLDKINLTNKKVIVFCTSGGSPLQPAVTDLNKIYPNANIEAGKRI